MKIKLVAITPKQAKLSDPKLMIEAVETALDAAAEGARTEFDVTTLTWEHNVPFYIQSKTEERIIYTTNNIYWLVSGGIKTHPIAAVNAPSLAFFCAGFKPKSKPNAIRNLVGKKANSKFVTPMVVNHPGNDPRYFHIIVKEDWQNKCQSLYREQSNQR
jgi:hypothetical protein